MRRRPLHCKRYLVKQARQSGARSNNIVLEQVGSSAGSFGLIVGVKSSGMGMNVLRFDVSNLKRSWQLLRGVHGSLLYFDALAFPRLFVLTPFRTAGVFASMFADRLSKGRPLSFSQVMSCCLFSLFSFLVKCLLLASCFRVAASVVFVGHELYNFWCWGWRRCWRWLC